MRFLVGTNSLKLNLTKLFHYGVIVIAGLSTILRPSIESKITLFRVLLPFLFLWLFVVNTKRALRLSAIILIFLLYSLLVSFLSRFETFNIPYNLYYITIFFFFFYYKEVIRACGSEGIFKFLALIYKVIIVLGLVQFFFGGVYFNTQDRLPAVNLFFWNENELSAVLAIFTPLFFLKEKKASKFLWIALALFLIIHNDAKLAILSLLVFFGGYLIIKLRPFRIRYFGFFLLGILGIVALFFVRDYSIKGEYTIKYFSTRLVEHVISQEPLIHIGTFNARSNAVILGVREFIDSYLLGIGPGNSLLMMKEIVVPGTEQYTALSMHNFTLQMLTETGIFGITVLVLFLLKVIRAGQRSIYPSNLVFIFFASCVISITLLSGAWSNYFYLFILFYALDFFGRDV